MENKRFNLIGFGRLEIDTKQYRHCSIHPYKRLIESKTDLNLLFCPECGSEYPVKETVLDQDIESKFGTNEETKIIQAKKKKKYTDSMGNPIPTDDKMQWQI
jgi:hypothetical protein